MYNVFRDVDLYVGARVNSSLNGGENGFLSGVSYKISDRFSVKSTLYTANKNFEDKQTQRSDGCRAFQPLTPDGKTSTCTPLSIIRSGSKGLNWG